MSQRMDGDNRVTLYGPMVEDLGIKPGDLVIFARNESGRWEVVNGREFADAMRQLFDEHVS